MTGKPLNEVPSLQPLKCKTISVQCPGLNLQNVQFQSYLLQAISQNLCLIITDISLVRLTVSILVLIYMYDFLNLNALNII